MKKHKGSLTYIPLTFLGLVAVCLLIVKLVYSVDKGKNFRYFTIEAKDRGVSKLVRSDGNVIHKWKDPSGSACWDKTQIMANGHLLALCFGEGIIDLDQDNRITQIYKGRAHHDFTAYSDSILFLEKELTRIPGRFSFDVEMDVVKEINLQGKEIWSWHARDYAHEIFKRISELHLRTSILQLGDDFGHANSVSVLPPNPLEQTSQIFSAGNILLSFRNFSTAFIINKRTGAVAWHYTLNTPEGIHSAKFLKSGKLLLFDNGYFRGFSQVLLIDPISKKTEWNYHGESNRPVFSEQGGSVYPLDSGNFIVNSAFQGRVFEINRNFQILWEYQGPRITKMLNSNALAQHLAKGKRLHQFPPLDIAVTHWATPYSPEDIRRFIN